MGRVQCSTWHRVVAIFVIVYRVVCNRGTLIFSEMKLWLNMNLSVGQICHVPNGNEIGEAGRRNWIKSAPFHLLSLRGNPCVEGRILFNMCQRIRYMCGLYYNDEIIWRQQWNFFLKKATNSIPLFVFWRKLKNAIIWAKRWFRDRSV
jgi:hypothetical protein